MDLVPNDREPKKVTLFVDITGSTLQPIQRKRRNSTVESLKRVLKGIEWGTSIKSGGPREPNTLEN